MTHYKLVAEDLIQKIKVSPLRPNIEVPFKFFTAHTQLLDHYEIEYTIHTSEKVTHDNEGDDDGHDYWNNLGEEELHNIENMMEG